MPAAFRERSFWSTAAARSCIRRAGLCRCRAQGAGQGRHHLPHLFDDQADHVGRLHDAGRGRPRRARRARPQIHSGMEEPRRVPGRHRAGLSDQAADAADADRRPAAAHLRPDLRLPAALQCRRRLSREARSARSIKAGTLQYDDRRTSQKSRWNFRRAKPGTIRSPPT